jgi:hypothetical protein
MSHVYLIEMVGTPYVKVGVALNPKARLRELQVASPFLLRVREQASYFRDAYEVEAEVHETLKVRHVRGEWFHWPEGWTLEDAVNGPAVRASTLEWLERSRPRFAAASERLSKFNPEQWRRTITIHTAMQEEHRASGKSSTAVISSVLDRFQYTELPHISPHLHNGP